MRIIIVSPQDRHILLSSDWNVNSNGYAISCGQLLHRVIMGATSGQLVDHINGDTLDNRRENLRFCTHAQNMQNSKVRSHNQTGVKGVTRHRCKYRACIRENGKQVRLGSFGTIAEAKACYDAAALRIFGEFART